MAESKMPTIEEIRQIVDVGVGFVPGINPLISIASAWYDFLGKGENPVDNFRGNNVIKRKNFNAGGMRATKDMLTWSFEKAGGSGIISWFDYDPTKNTTREYVMKGFPILSRVYKESSAGDSEMFRKINESVKEQAAKKISAQDDAIDKIVDKYFDENSDTKATGKLQLSDYYKKLKIEYFGKDRQLNQDEQVEYRNIKDKLKLRLVGGIKGDHQQVVDAIINSYNTDAIVEILKAYKETHSDAEYDAVKKYLKDNGIKPNAIKKAP
jgi:hypothetical protein